MERDGERIEITISSRFENIELVQVIAEHLCENAGVDEDGSHWIGMAVREAVANAITAGHTKILLDMSGVTTIDSSGIGELVGSYTTVANRGGKLKLLHLPAKLNELLHVTQLITVFEVYDSEQEALNSF